MILLDKLDESLHELCTAAMIFWSIIQIEHQRGNMRIALPYRVPPLDQPVHEAVAGDFGRHAIEKQFIRGRQEDAHRVSVASGAKS